MKKDYNKMRYCKGDVLLVKYPYVKLETNKDGFSLTKANPNDPGIILKSDCSKRIIVSKALDRSYLVPDAIPVEQIPGGLFYRIDQKFPFPAYDDREIDVDLKGFQDLCELTLLSKTKLSLLHIELSCWGGMGKYDFDNFYEDVTEKRDLETQEELLKILNLLLDEGILCFPKKGEENDI